MDPADHEELLHYYFCELYKLWTGKPDCNDLVRPTASGRAQEILDFYDQNGTQPLPPANVQAFLAKLAQIKAILEDPNNPLSADLTTKLLQMIAALQAALGNSNP